MGEQVDARLEKGLVAQPVRAHSLISVRSVVRVHSSPLKDSCINAESQWEQTSDKE